MPTTARRQIWNPADNQWIYDDTPDTGQTPPTLDAVGGALGVTPPAQTATTPTTPPAGSDYDPTWEAANADLTFQQNQANSGYTDQLNALNQYYQPQYGQLNQQQADAEQNWRAQAAQQGALHSSNYLTGKSKVDTNYQNMYGGLLQAQQQQQTALSQQKLNALAAIANKLGIAQGAHTNFEGQAAQARALQQAQTEAAQQAQQQQDQQNLDLQNQLGVSPTGQYIPQSITSGSPPPNVNEIGQHAVPEYQQLGFGSQDQLNSVRDPQQAAQRLLSDYNNNIGMVDNDPYTLQHVRDVFTQQSQSDPLLQGPMFDAIRKRLGL